MVNYRELGRRFQQKAVQRCFENLVAEAGGSSASLLQPLTNDLVEELHKHGLQSELEAAAISAMEQEKDIRAQVVPTLSDWSWTRWQNVGVSWGKDHHNTLLAGPSSDREETRGRKRKRGAEVEASVEKFLAYDSRGSRVLQNVKAPMVSEISSQCNVSRATVYRACSELRSVCNDCDDEGEEWTGAIANEEQTSRIRPATHYRLAPPHIYRTVRLYTFSPE